MQARRNPPQRYVEPIELDLPNWTLYRPPEGFRRIAETGFPESDSSIFQAEATKENGTDAAPAPETIAEDPEAEAEAEAAEEEIAAEA